MTTAHSFQRMFDPTDYGFKFTSDWYEFDRKAGHKAALKARNAEAKSLKAKGYNVKTWTLPNQLITLGGIGTGKPQIEEVVSVYVLDAWM